MELNKIYNESNLETLKRLADSSIDVVLTSPFYNTNKKAKITNVQYIIVAYLSKKLFTKIKNNICSINAGIIAIALPIIFFILHPFFYFISFQYTISSIEFRFSCIALGVASLEGYPIGNSATISKLSGILYTFLTISGLKAPIHVVPSPRL